MAKKKSSSSAPRARDMAAIERHVHGIDERAGPILTTLEGVIYMEQSGVFDHFEGGLSRGSLSRTLIDAAFASVLELHAFHDQLKKELGIATLLGEVDEGDDTWRVPLERVEIAEEGKEAAHG